MYYSCVVCQTKVHHIVIPFVMASPLFLNNDLHVLLCVVCRPAWVVSDRVVGHFLIIHIYFKNYLTLYHTTLLKYIYSFINMFSKTKFVSTLKCIFLRRYGK